MKNDQHDGPYADLEVISMLQNKQLHRFHFVWASHMEFWTAIADLPEFSEEKISHAAEQSKSSEVFKKRNHQRFPCSLSIYAHDNLRLCQGFCNNLSQGGALIRVNNPFFIPGDKLQIHYRSSTATDNISSPFNTTAEVLTKQFSKLRIQHNTELNYAIKFLNLPSKGLQQIQNWLQEFKLINKITTSN